MAAPKYNLFALGNCGGRQPIYETEQQLIDKCNEYFEWCITNKEVITISGLCLFLDISRTTLHRWANGELDEKNKVISNIIKRAIAVVENAYEKKLDTFAFGGAIFALKNINKEYWRDEVKQEVNQKITNVTANFGATLQSPSEPSKDSQ